MKLLVLSCLVVLATALPVDVEWESWKQVCARVLIKVCLLYSVLYFPQEHGKQYSDDKTESLRYTIWKSNSDYVEEHNKAGKSYTLGMNQFGDLTVEEFAELNGYMMRPLTNSTHDVFMATLGYVPTDDTVDWREKGAVTEVKNQGQCGSCWSFSTTGSLEGQHFLKSGKLVSLSEQNLMDCSRKYGNKGCQGGLMDNAFKYIIENGGIDTEKSYPYKAHDESKCRFKTADVGATMKKYKNVLHRDVESLTKAVETIGPISVAMDASHRSFQLYKEGVYDEPKCSSTKLDHGVLAVGYGTYKGQDYFLVKNSWGERWGMEGYFMIERSRKNMCGLATQASYPEV